MPEAGLDLPGVMPLDAALVLQVGCGAGALGQAYRRRNPRAEYFGVERDAAAARQAAGVLNAVVVGDIEAEATVVDLDRRLTGRRLDLLVFDGVLETLADPGRVLAALRDRMEPGAALVAQIADSAPQPRLSERAVALFRDAGWTLTDAKLPPPPPDAATAPRWLVRCVNGPAPAALAVNAATPRIFAGITQARTEEPLAALATRPGVWVRWDAGGVRASAAQPGLLVFQRMLMEDDAMWAALQGKIAQGWTVISDIDDDPRIFQPYVDTDFRAFRGAHALTVSTPALAALMRDFNPNLIVLPNAIDVLPEPPPSTPKSGARLRLVFAALNRGPDWAPMMATLGPALAALDDRIEVLVLHDRAFFDALPDRVAKRFYPTLRYDQYKAALLTCDLALLPLADTEFNRYKSDLKLIECCAAGAVPICSPTVYADDPRNAAVSVMVDRPELFADAVTALCLDLPRMARLRAAGRAYVAGERMHAYHVAAREAFYRDVVHNREALELQRRDRMTQSAP